MPMSRTQDMYAYIQASRLAWSNKTWETHIKLQDSQDNHPCFSLRVENRPSVLGIFIYVPWGGVGWGNNVHVLAHSHDVTPRHVHLHVRTYVMLRWRCVTSRRGGVGWGGVITFTYLPVFPISWHLAQKTNKNWMTSFGRTFAHGSGDGRQM